MKVELIENAIDSLQIAMNAFTIWNNEFESKHNFRFSESYRCTSILASL